MATKKITLNELRNLVKKTILENRRSEIERKLRLLEGRGGSGKTWISIEAGETLKIDSMYGDAKTVVVPSHFPEELEIEVEYGIEPGGGDGWNEPRYGASVEVSDLIPKKTGIEELDKEIKEWVDYNSDAIVDTKMDMNSVIADSEPDYPEYENESVSLNELRNMVRKVIKEQFDNAGKITRADIVQGAKFKLKSGSIFIIDEIGEYDERYGWTPVKLSLEGGKKGSYKNDIDDLVDFLNEEDAILIQ